MDELYQKSATHQSKTDQSDHREGQIHRALRKSIDIAVNRATRSVETNVEMYSDECDTDAERLFLIGLASLRSIRFYDSDHLDNTNGLPAQLADGSILCREIESESVAGDFHAIAAIPQARLFQHQVDFLLVGFDPVCGNGELLRWEPVCVAVECGYPDTDQSAEYRSQKSRSLASLGIRVVHYTDAEIWSDPHKCATEAFRLVDGYIEGYLRYTPNGGNV